jgi:signal transduction histidine kinase
VSQGQHALNAFRQWRYAGALVLVVGCALVTALAFLLKPILPVGVLGAAYIPLIAMLTYYWGWRLCAVALTVQLLVVYLTLPTSRLGLPALRAPLLIELGALGAISVYVLLLVQLARSRREAAERELARVVALNTVGAALTSELREERLLQMIASTACKLTGAQFAAFTLRPLDARGQPLTPADGSHFHLAAVIGVTPQQEALFRSASLGGEGLLAPIFRDGATVRVDDALAAPMPNGFHNGGAGKMPRGHPFIRSFLGAPLLDREGAVRGGLLLGHDEPQRFTADDEALLKALAAQAAIALENARLYRNAESQAAELGAVFESMTDGVMVFSQRGALLHENHAVAPIRAMLAQDPNGRTLTLTLDRLVAAALTESEVEPAQTPLKVRDAQGDCHDYTISAAPLQRFEIPTQGSERRNDRDDASNPVAQGVVVIWHEVTETRKLLAARQARAEAERRRALLQRVIDEQPGGVYLVQGRDARLVLANRSARDVWGAEWRTGQTMGDFLTTTGICITTPGGQVISLDDLATIRTLRVDEDVRHFQEVIRRPDGARLPILLNAVRLDSAIFQISEPTLGSEPMALVALQDVTAMKEAERLKDEFIAIAAHELKTPIAAVKGYAEMLIRQDVHGAATELAPWQVEALETIDQATTRLTELTDDLLDVARLQAARLQLHIEPHDLIALARRVIKRFQVVSAAHMLTLDANNDYAVTLLDVRRTEQILSNLLSNAIKYSPNGGEIRVTIDEDDARGVVTLTVRDHGIGIPADQRALLFNRFARANNARERGIAGTGLGLYLCRELAELQGGRLWFDSEEDQGSVFYLTAPMVCADGDSDGNPS